MITRKELINAKEYWITKIQLDLFNQIKDYLKKTGKNQAEFAKDLKVSRGYVTQILNGDYDHKISKWVDLSLAVGKVPLTFYVDINEDIEFLTLVDSRKPRLCLFKLNKDMQQPDYPPVHANSITSGLSIITMETKTE